MASSAVALAAGVSGSAGVPQLAMPHAEPPRRIFEHPRTGVALPDVVYFDPEGCSLIDEGRLVRPGGFPRGVIHFLSTGGGASEWINPADGAALLREIEAMVREEEAKVLQARGEALEMEDALCRLEDREERGERELAIIEGRIRDADEMLEELEAELRSERSVRRPHTSGIDAIRRRVHELISASAADAREASALRDALNTKHALRKGIEELHARADAAEKSAKAFKKREREVGRGGFVQVTTSGWQKGHESDIIGEAAVHAWSDYMWFPDGCAPADRPPRRRRLRLRAVARESEEGPRGSRRGGRAGAGAPGGGQVLRRGGGGAGGQKEEEAESESEEEGGEDDGWGVGAGGHPQGRASGAWFQVDLPPNLDLKPTHYALRHGDDASVSGVRHDSDCSLTQGCPGGAPKSSWGATTRAKKGFVGAAMRDWELWGYADADERAPAGWVLLASHSDEGALRDAWACGIWRVAHVGRHVRSFRVVMTGPTNNGGHALFCSGFEIFGQVGEPVAVKPIPKPPRGLRYKYNYELYACEKDITPNTCTVDGTNDEECPMTFTATPPLPFGLDINPSDGTISGCVEYEELEDSHCMLVDKGKVIHVLVTAQNSAGSDQARLRIVIMQPPSLLTYEHTDVTFQARQPAMAFSKEILERARRGKWRRRPNAPVDLKRDVLCNRPVPSVCSLGTAVTWAASEPSPEVAGKPVDWDEPRIWPKFRAEPALPEGLSIDQRTGRISGVAVKETGKTEYKIIACNPVGEVECRVFMCVMEPPSDLLYEFGDLVLKQSLPMSSNSCTVKGSQPIKFKADKMAVGLAVNEDTGEMTGTPESTDDDFVEYTITAWNDVAQATAVVKILCTILATQSKEDDAQQLTSTGRIVNREVEPKVGLKVEGSEQLIVWREQVGLADPSATRPRGINDNKRARVLEREASQTVQGLLASSSRTKRKAPKQDFLASNKHSAKAEEEGDKQEGTRGLTLDVGKAVGSTIKQNLADINGRGAHERGSRSEAPHAGGYRVSVKYPEEAGRGTIIQILDEGNICQVRWDKTGLVSNYYTGRDGHFFLAAWGTAERTIGAWKALPRMSKTHLHDNLGDFICPFLDEHNLNTGVRPVLTKDKFVGLKHVHKHGPAHAVACQSSGAGLQEGGGGSTGAAEVVKPASGGVPGGKPGRGQAAEVGSKLERQVSKSNVDGEFIFTPCPRGSGILQRLVNELDAGWMQQEDYEEFRDKSLWMAMQVRDAIAGRVVDWDTPISFFEFLSRKEMKQMEVGGKSAKSGKKGVTKQAPSKSEEKCAQVWLAIDVRMREALQDNLPEEKITQAVFDFSSQHIRRMSKKDFSKGLLAVSTGSRLGITLKDTEMLFAQMDSDKDGYITFFDFVRSYKETVRLDRYSKSNEKKYGLSRAVPAPDPALLGRHSSDLSWIDVMRKVFTRPTSLTFMPAADAHSVVRGALRGNFPQFELHSTLEGVQATQKRIALLDEDDSEYSDTLETPRRDTREEEEKRRRQEERRRMEDIGRSGGTRDREARDKYS